MGLYPESHGIVANSFYDPELGAFTSTDQNSTWWNGVPIWNTITLQGLKSASYFWFGSDSEIGGQRPTYWFPYNNSIPFEDRVDQVLEWVRMKQEERPAWISLYFSEPDHRGHMEGPDSDGVNEQLQIMDDIIKRLVTGLEEDNLLDCVNLILVSDHGMAAGGENWAIKLKDYIEDSTELASSYTGTFTRISLGDSSKDAKNDTMQKLACKRSDMRVYEKEGLPKRLHYCNNNRIEDLLIELNPGRVAVLDEPEHYNNGNHGYDNYFSTMNALFVARGPGFKSGVVTRPFQNFQLYNMMCHLTGVPPEPNNGTMGALNDILNDPGPIEDLVKAERPLVTVYPDKEKMLQRLEVPGCPGKLTADEEWLDVLDYTTEEQEVLEAKHAPWGLPQVLNKDAHMLLLHQPDHVTGYSTSWKTPLWASFTLRGAPGGTPQSDWISDVRLNENITPNCEQYDILSNAIQVPLFYPGFSSNSSLAKIPYMVSNAVPSTTQQQKHWQDLMGRLVMKWLVGGNLNLVVGPVFDLDSDSNADPFSSTESYPVRPSDLFAMVTRCTTGVNMTDCKQEHIDTRVFIFPTEVLLENCMEEDEYARKFSSTVQDLRTATGLAFFPTLDAVQRATLV
ncbi:Type I phosphodiesterase/nucleotide pyrophosphatase/phosphate transferase [Trinorchestia longiramus]|nr:Type I phosphodiesterase/nucleotide pyrophosphatase/phosphate transferase [Trinorchestia longiramus]